MPREEWASTSVVEVILPLEKIKDISPDKGTVDPLEQMDRARVNQLLVMSDARIVGMPGRRHHFPAHAAGTWFAVNIRAGQVTGDMGKGDSFNLLDKSLQTRQT